MVQGTKEFLPHLVASGDGHVVNISSLFGLVSFELFGQFENVVTDRSGYFDHAVSCLGRVTGIPA